MRSNSKPPERVEVMQGLYEEGATLDEIGETYGISYQRVGQLIDTKAKRALRDKRRKIDRHISDAGIDTQRKTWRAAERFWSRAHKGPDGCWEFSGARWGKAEYQYGHISGGMHLAQYYGEIYAHRLSWAICNGPIPIGFCVLHTCDNCLCINPDHLWIGTIADNNADRDAKGRVRGGPNAPGRKIRRSSTIDSMEIV